MSNPFNTKQIKEVSKTNNRSKLGFGIHDDCVMSAVEVGVTSSGSQYIDLIFERPATNEWNNKRIWYPSDDAKPRDGETQEEANNRDITQRLEHIVAVMDVYLTDKESEVQATTFDEFCQKAVRALGNKFVGVPVRLKLTYDKDGIYSEFPRFPGYVERQIEGSPTRLKFSKWELENRCTPSDGPDSNSPGLTAAPDVTNLF